MSDSLSSDWVIATVCKRCIVNIFKSLLLPQFIQFQPNFMEVWQSGWIQAIIFLATCQIWKYTALWRWVTSVTLSFCVKLSPIHSHNLWSWMRWNLMFNLPNDKGDPFLLHPLTCGITSPSKSCRHLYLIFPNLIKTYLFAQWLMFCAMSTAVEWDNRNQSHETNAVAMRALYNSNSLFFNCKTHASINHTQLCFGRDLQLW